MQGELWFAIALLIAIPISTWQAYRAWFKVEQIRKEQRILLEYWEKTEYIKFLMLFPRRRISARKQRLESGDWIDTWRLATTMMLLIEIGLLVRLVIVGVIKGI
jgi:hypothetical protein